MTRLDVPGVLQEHCDALRCLVDSRLSVPGVLLIGLVEVKIGRVVSDVAFFMKP